ncbi:MAG: GFA family protein [Rhodospirillaceae bacterium]|nr:GFA family protein [Rhodospirillaceae bacterium]MBL6930296.1 GFA family protein [Rhodospirillales bacterium]MBL6940654.1 GFA family protein [Rhodospirillales bacterium]
MNKTTGTCHCGSVEIEIPYDGKFKKLRRCDCSYCSRRWAVVASVRVEDLKVLKGEDKLSLYQWGTGVARHYFCSVCGIYTHHQRRSDPTEYGVNIACFEQVNVRDYRDVEYSDGVNHPRDRD